MNEGVDLVTWRGAGRDFHWCRHRIRCWDSAPGELARTPLLLIHGFPTAAWDWNRLWPALAAQGRVIALDMLGFGDSDKPLDHDYPVADQADLCEALLRAHGIAHYHVLAHDYGDTVAQELLARQSEDGERPQLRSLCLLNGGLFPEAHRPRLIQHLLASPLGGMVARFTTRARFASTLRDIFGPHTPPSTQEVDAFWSLIESNHGRRVMPRLIRYMQERRLRRARWVGALESARIPLCLIDGIADPISGSQLVRRWRELLPQAALVELAGIGHYPQIEAPDAVLDGYRAFRAAPSER